MRVRARKINDIPHLMFCGDTLVSKLFISTENNKHIIIDYKTLSKQY